MREQTRRRDDKGTPSWWITYGDITTQLLCFFVLLLSISVMDPLLWSDVRESLDGDRPPSAHLDARPADFLHWVQAQVPEATALKEVFPLALGDESYRAWFLRDGMMIAIQDGVLFEEGKAELAETGQKALVPLQERLRSMRNEVVLIGHTAANAEDSLQGDHELLGFERARAVRNFLREGTHEEKPPYLSSFRLASEGAQKPLRDHADPMLRWCNRRVEIKILHY